MTILNTFYDEYASQCGLERYMLTHNRGVEYAKCVSDLDFSAVDSFSVWSVFVDYRHHQACIALVLPRSVSIPATSYAVDVDGQGVGYVDGVAFIPGVIRAQLIDFASQGKYDVYGRCPCVTVRPAEASTSSDAGIVLA